MSFFRLTLTRFLRAWAMALEIATGTSRALPKPKPTEVLNPFEAEPPAAAAPQPGAPEVAAPEPEASEDQPEANSAIVLPREKPAELRKPEPTTIAVACPFCMVMFEDAAKNTGADEAVARRDVAELLLASLASEQA